MMTELNILARTLADRAADDLWNDLSEFQREITDSERDAEYADFVAAAIGPVEAVIREAIDKTIEIAASTVGTAKSSHGCDDFIIRNDAEEAIRSLKQSNSVAEDEGPCADCGRPKSDSAMHLDSPGKGWGAALHWFKQSNSGRAEQGIVREK